MTAPVILQPQSREEWLEARLSGVSGSDVAAIVGMSPFRTAMDVFCEKLRLTEGQEETLQMRVGKALGPMLADEYQRQTGLIPFRQDALYRDGDRPWMIGTPDAFVDDPVLGVEFKTASLRQEHDWGDGDDEIPDYYLTQIAWYAAITKREDWHCAVLIGNSDFRVYTIRRNRHLEAVLVEKAQEFWERHVLAQEPPVLDGSDSAQAYLRSRFPVHRAPLRPASPEEDSLAAELSATRKCLADLEERKAELEARLKLVIADAEGIQGGSWRATWKKTKDSSSVNWEAVVKHLPQDEQLKKLIRGATRTKPGVRRFLFKTQGEAE